MQKSWTKSNGSGLLSSNNFRDSLNVWSTKDHQAPPTNETSTGIDHQSVLQIIEN